MRTGWHPAIEPRLLRIGDGGREELDAYLALGGYGGGAEGAALLQAVEAAGLRGRGGAAFPVAAKWRAVAGSPGRHHVVANGEEGEPVSLKDRYLLRVRPHLVIDGLLRAARAVGATDAVIYLADAEAELSVGEALRELRQARPALVGDIELELFCVAHTYVAGEETAAVRAIDGGPAKPTAKPPRPFERGLNGEPTLVQNVETLANVPFIARHGPAAFRAVGTRGSPGTVLFTARGRCARPGVYELPLGISLADAFGVAGGLEGPPGGFLMGGYFAGMLAPHRSGLQLDYDLLRQAGSGLGCAAVTVLGERDCPVRAAADVMAFFAEEQSGQCGVCTRGTAAMAAALRTLCAGEANDGVIANLRRWSRSLAGRGACALLDGATQLVASLLREFPDAVAAHLRSVCPRCTSSDCAENVLVPTATVQECR